MDRWIFWQNIIIKAKNLIATVLGLAFTAVFSNTCPSRIFPNGQLCFWWMSIICFYGNSRTRILATPWCPWKALEFNSRFQGPLKSPWKEELCWKCLKIMKTPWIFIRMGNNVGLYQSNLGIEHRFQNWGQILQKLRCCMLGEMLLEYLVFGAWILLEYSLNFMSKNQHGLWEHVLNEKQFGSKFNTEWKIEKILGEVFTTLWRFCIFLTYSKIWQTLNYYLKSNRLAKVLLIESSMALQMHSKHLKMRSAN